MCSQGCTGCGCVGYVALFLLGMNVGRGCGNVGRGGCSRRGLCPRRQSGCGCGGYGGCVRPMLRTESGYEEECYYARQYGLPPCSRGYSCGASVAESLL